MFFSKNARMQVKKNHIKLGNILDFIFKPYQISRENALCELKTQIYSNFCEELNWMHLCAGIIHPCCNTKKNKRFINNGPILVNFAFLKFTYNATNKPKQLFKLIIFSI